MNYKAYKPFFKELKYTELLLTLINAVTLFLNICC